MLKIFTNDIDLNDIIGKLLLRLVIAKKKEILNATKDSNKPKRSTFLKKLVGIF